MEHLTAILAEGEFSFATLFWRAHPFVQGVIVVLIVASVWSWALIIERWRTLARCRRTAGVFERAFWSGSPLEELFARVRDEPTSPLERVFTAGMQEWNRSFDGSGSVIAGARMRIQRVMSVAVAREVDRLQGGLGILATVGSVSPFIGLFGTVWGIKNSFESIALSQNTNLAVVAPGIAEALFATALGLLAAIPAVIAYNRYASEVTRIGTRMENFTEEFIIVVSRQLDSL